ncbi:MAG: hypothetical protein DDT18_00857 [Actinobacteria bacterium]|nr:hypothetical protein [Actinomycetota bacterium]
MDEDSPEAEGTGLDRGSVVQAEAIPTVPKTSVVKRLGRFKNMTIRAIEQWAKMSLSSSQVGVRPRWSSYVMARGDMVLTSSLDF